MLRKLTRTLRRETLESSRENEYSPDELHAISRRVLREEYRIFARFLCFSTKRIEELEAKHMTNECDDAELVYAMLAEWKRINGQKASKDVLIEALKSIDRSDIIDEVFSGQCTERELLKVSMKISKEEMRPLSRILGVTDQEIDKIEMECNQKRCGDAEILFQILHMWRTRNQYQGTKTVLIKAIKEIGRTDVLNEVFTEYMTISHRPLTDLQTNIQAKQTRYFRDIQLSRALWMKRKTLRLQELFVELTMNTENKCDEKVDLVIEKEEIFERNENGIPRRILIEGHPGYGKTTFLLKLLSDWAREENYIRNKFDLVFVIPLRFFQGDISTHFLQQCQGVDGEDDDKVSSIKAIENRVLLLLDGLDETSKTVHDILFPVIKGDQYPTMTVIATCRTGIIHLKPDAKDDFTSTGIRTLENRSVWDKKINIIGISEQRRKDFLQKYFKLDAHELNEKLSTLNVKLNDFYQCPLFLLLLAVLIQERDIQFIRTKSELYKAIFNFVINRNLEREKIVEKEIDVFENIDGLGCQTLLINLGKLCLKKIKTRSLSFEENEFRECSSGNFFNFDMIVKLGFILKDKLFLRDREKERYELIHQSFVEFLAAFYLYSLSESDMHREIQELTTIYDIWPNEDQLLYVFLGGFLHSSANVLFNALSTHKDLISIFDDKRFCSVESILIEIPISDEILSSLMAFTTTHWECVTYKRSLAEWYISVLNHYQVNEVKHNISLRFPENLNVVEYLPNYFKINDIIFDVNKLEERENIMEWRDKKIYCEHLSIQMNASSVAFPFSITNLISTATSRGVSSNLQLLLRIIKADRISLNVDFQNLKPEFVRIEIANFFKLHKAMIEARHFKLHHLSLHGIGPSYFRHILYQIRDLLKLQRIEHGLNISISSAFRLKNTIEDELNSFINIVSNSGLKSLGFVHFYNGALSFPLNLSNSEQQREIIGLQGKFTGFNINEMHTFSITHLHCIHLILEDRTLLPKLLLTCKDIKRVSCNQKLICDLSELSESSSVWNGFDTIERVDISCDYTVGDEDLLLPGISLFKNLQELSLRSSFVGHHGECLIQLLRSLPSLKKLSFHIVFKESVQFLTEFLELLISKDKREKTGINLREFQIEGLRGRNYASTKFVTFVENCLLEKLFFKFSTLDKGVWNDYTFIKHFLSKPEFKVCSEWNEEINVYQMFEPGFHELPKFTQKLCVNVNLH